MSHMKKISLYKLFILVFPVFFTGYDQKTNQNSVLATNDLNHLTAEMFTFSKGISSFQPEKTEIKKRKYIEAVIPGVDKKMTKITGDFGKSLNHPGNLAPFPTKSLQPMIKLKLWGIIGNKQVNLHSFYLQEGPLTQVTNLVRANAELIANGSTTEETVKNILEWLHSALQIGTCDNHRDAVSADHLIQRRCLSGCTDYTIVFAALARAKGISATVTETVSEKWIAEMVWNNSWNPSKEGHFYSEVYLPERSAWIVVDPTANQLTGRDNNGYYVLNGKRYLLFERGLDPADYGLITDAEFAGAVKKKYYVEPGDQP